MHNELLEGYKEGGRGAKHTKKILIHFSLCSLVTHKVFTKFPCSPSIHVFLLYMIILALFPCSEYMPWSFPTPEKPLKNSLLKHGLLYCIFISHPLKGFSAKFYISRGVYSSMNFDSPPPLLFIFDSFPHIFTIHQPQWPVPNSNTVT